MAHAVVVLPEPLKQSITKSWGKVYIFNNLCTRDGGKVAGCAVLALTTGYTSQTEVIHSSYSSVDISDANPLILGSSHWSLDHITIRLACCRVQRVDHQEQLAWMVLILGVWEGCILANST